uniref:DNA-directed RNA polymerase subunit beta''-like n=1 Tax=Dermatophagoides pteronyssinus TaxID=6956 RepID=A0A6P6Y9H0_DERPT|nr:DNA-directed RNA polymerase subunit beta''-like [Dermatophagoides pteronyssinus]
MDESVLRSYCPYDTTAAPLFDYQNNETSLNIIENRLTSIIFLIFFIFILYSHYILFLTDHNSIAWRLLYDVSNRNYDQYRDSIINEQNISFTKSVIKALSYDNNKFEEFISNSSTKIMHNSLARIMKKNPKSFIDKLIIQLMLYIDLYKFEKLRLKVFSYAGLKQRIELAITMFTLHCIDVFMMILVISTTFNLGLNYLRNLFWGRFQRQHQHMTYCMMYSGHDVWNNVYLIAVMANIPLNIVCIYNLVFKSNSWNNELISLGFLSAQMYILSAIMAMTSTIHFFANQFKRQLPAIQLYMKDPSIKWQVHEFYERLTTTGIGFGYYCGRIALINYHNSFQLLISYFGLMLITFTFLRNNNQ